MALKYPVFYPNDYGSIMVEYQDTDIWIYWDPDIALNFINYKLP